GIDRSTRILRREERDETIDVTAKEYAPSQRQTRRRDREQMTCIEHLERLVLGGVVRHLRDNPGAHSKLDVGLDDVGVERCQHDVWLQPFGCESGGDCAASGESEIVCKDELMS